MASQPMPLLRHWIKNTSLIALSLFFLPLSTTLLFFFLARQFFSSLTKDQHGPKPKALRKTILITGVSMTKGMTIARLLSMHTPHTIIGADTSSLSTGRVSRHCHRFFTLPTPDSRDPSNYIQAMLTLASAQNVDLWISCSGVSSAVEDAQIKQILEKRTTCRCVQFDVEATTVLHEKDRFIRLVRDECGLVVPETVEVTSRAEALDVLLPAKPKSNGSVPAGKAAQRNGVKSRKSYILKPIGVDDAHRADMTLLPYTSVSSPPSLSPEDATENHIRRLPISKDRPWQLQEYIRGREFCTHALVIDGAVRVFVACPSAELLMHYEALPPPSESALSRAMLLFTQKVAAVMQRKSTDGFTGHLSFDFLVRDEDLKPAGGEKAGPAVPNLYPIECNPRCHTAVVLLRDAPEAAAAYLDVLFASDGCSKANGRQRGRDNSAGTHGTKPEPFYPRQTGKFYWLPHDLVTLGLLPLLSRAGHVYAALLSLLGLPLPRTLHGAGREATGAALLRDWRVLLHHLLDGWEEGSFTIEDPVTAWWLYHVYWPSRFAESLWKGRKWSRVNVSTTKMFLVE